MLDKNYFKFTVNLFCYFSGEFPDALHESGVSSVWSNSYIGRFLTASNLKMETRTGNYLSIRNTLFSIASFKFFMCFFICLVAHLVLLNIVMLLLFGHHEHYDLVTQKQLFTCAANTKKSIVSNKKEKLSRTATSNHETKTYNWKGGNSINSSRAQIGIKL